jgi:ADP-heptose:LPS heptosyltransferase
MTAAAPVAARSVLAFRIGSLGDTVVALPALHEIRRRHPGATIAMLTNTPVDGGVRAASSALVLAGSGLVDEFIEYPHGSRSPWRMFGVVRNVRLRAPRTCYYLMPQRSPAQIRRDHLFLRLSGVEEIVGMQFEHPGNLPPRGASGLWESEARRLMRAIGAGGRPLDPEDFALHLSAAEVAEGRRCLEEAGIGAGFLAFSIGAKLAVNDWGDLRWTRCLAEIARVSDGLALVAFGAQAEALRSQRLLDAWPGTTLNLCGRVAPRVSAAVLARAGVFLGHDSGPMHLAQAAGAKVVAVFSARQMAGKWFPFAQEQNVFFRDVPCGGCELETCIEQAQRCLTEIAPRDVAARVVQMLRGTAAVGENIDAAAAIGGR